MFWLRFIIKMHRRRVQSGLWHQLHNITMTFDDSHLDPCHLLRTYTYILLYVLKSMRPSIYYYDVSWMSILFLCVVLQDDLLQEFDLLGAATVESNGYVLRWATGSCWQHAIIELRGCNNRTLPNWRSMKKYRRWRDRPVVQTTSLYPMHPDRYTIIICSLLMFQ